MLFSKRANFICWELRWEQQTIFWISECLWGFISGGWGPPQAPVYVDRTPRTIGGLLSKVDYLLSAIESRPNSLFQKNQTVVWNWLKLSTSIRNGLLILDIYLCWNIEKSSNSSFSTCQTTAPSLVLVLLQIIQMIKYNLVTVLENDSLTLFFIRAEACKDVHLFLFAMRHCTQYLQFNSCKFIRPKLRVSSYMDCVYSPHSQRCVCLPTQH